MKSIDHDCPGGCGTKVAQSRLACRLCWYLLPADLRRRVSARGRSLTVVAEALRWYRDNVTGRPT